MSGGGFNSSGYFQTVIISLVALALLLLLSAVSWLTIWVLFGIFTRAFDTFDLDLVFAIAIHQSLRGLSQKVD